MLTLTNWAAGSVLSDQTDQGVHIHTGTSCESAAATGGHFYSGEDDPWPPSTYTSTSEGVVSAAVITVSGVGKTMEEVAGHALVVHAGGEKVACGLLSVCANVRTSVWDADTADFVPDLAACDDRANCATAGTGRADAMPASLESIAAEWTANKQYEAFSCTRNLPECAANTAVLDNCERQCEAVNVVIGNFAAACETARATEADSGQKCTASGGATCVLTPAPTAWEAPTAARCINIADGTTTAEPPQQWEELGLQAACDAAYDTSCVEESAGFCINTADDLAGTCAYTPPSFQCFTLANDPNLANSCTGTGDPASASTTNWCNTARQRGLWGQNTCPASEGCPAAGMAQGWKRDCPALCREYQQNAPPAAGTALDEEELPSDGGGTFFLMIFIFCCVVPVAIGCKVLQMMGIIKKGEPEDIEMQASEE
eukprot:SAG22_NODE_89_length_21278_cov_16.698758_1_plen_430_part_00